MEDQPAYGVQPHALPGYLEKAQSRMSALHLLMQMGWSYLMPEEANRLRGGRLGGAILESVLVAHLRDHCRFTFKGATHPFTENAIQSAVQALMGFRAISATHRNEQAYDLLCLGTSVPQTIEGDTKSFILDYIDWRNPANNTFHCTAGFKVERVGFQKYHSPDIVLFVNGIPLVVMACKHSADTRTRSAPIDSAIAQLSDYQAKEGIPHLFLFTQLLLALAGDKARYGTTGTPPLYWSAWKESGLAGELRRTMDLSVDDAEMDKLFSTPFAEVGGANPSLAARGRGATARDQTLYALCRPQRLLELAYKFILFDAGTKMIARYQQYFSVQEILKRVLSAGQGRARPGGVVRHAQGSGKALTMVMLAKSLALHPSIFNPKIILVTDRTDLDDPIHGTFRACGLATDKAATGKQLVMLLRDPRPRVVTTLVHKFNAATANRDLKQVDRNTFVLVDESHRTAPNTQQAQMRGALKSACFIAFSGTPLAESAQKETLARFGELFRPAYTVRRAVEDKVLVPLLYEVRPIPQAMAPQAADGWFRRLTLGLTEAQRADLKRKFFTQRRLRKASHQVRMIAWDVSMHYVATYQDTGLKGQLVVPDKQAALAYKSFMDEFGLVVSEVLISAPTVPEGEDRQVGPGEAQKAFRQAVMDRYGSARNYSKQLINAFKHSDQPEIIIVVDPLLTGFDAPCNSVLYLARGLKAHALLQAIARVNRPYRGKEYGLILDYRSVIAASDPAIDFFGQLAEFDPADLASTVAYVQARTDRLPQVRAGVWELFAALKEAKDPEAYEIHLRDDGLRNRFHERFSLFARTLSLALSSTPFLMAADEKKIQLYKKDLKFFQHLRAAVSQRYQEAVDDYEYEPRIKKLLDTHVGAEAVQPLREPINLLDAGQRAQVLTDESKSLGAKADMIAAATRHVIEREMARDSVFYEKFSKRLRKVIEACHAGRLPAAEALDQIKDIAVKVTTHTDEDIPEELMGQEMARRYYGCVCESTPAYGPIDPKPAARIATLIAKRLSKHKTRDWRTNPDVINKMRGEIDDILFDVAQAAGIDLSLEDQDAIIERCMEAAIANED